MSYLLFVAGAAILCKCKDLAPCTAAAVQRSALFSSRYPICFRGCGMLSMHMAYKSSKDFSVFVFAVDIRA